ncbi:hypothetical protein GIB67_041686 [Kingdonia uniflora]|uniref:Uncharacterized protein n=1 Tax=Kingdonia uniflora TaxID=39325 RepID=A0A7J7MQN5_9MAGN|nr:hypothetical protein GIB67_041686 [Kingdonia uniflora]
MSSRGKSLAILWMLQHPCRSRHCRKSYQQQVNTSQDRFSNYPISREVIFSAGCCLLDPSSQLYPELILQL